MKSKNILVGGAALALIGVAAPAAADNINNGLWYTFGWNGGTVNTSLMGCTGCTLGTSPNAVAAPSGTTWTITLTKPEVLIVTDAFQSGDQFEILDNGVPLGFTSTPTFGQSVGPCISCALGNSAFSRGEWLLPAGTNVISGFWLAGGVGAGAGDFIVGAPEPGSWALMLAGFAGLGAALRSRRKLAPA